MLFCPLSLSALSIDSLFAEVPRSVLPLLDRTARLDLIDLYNGGLEARAENTLGGQAILSHKSSSSILLQLTAVSKWQLKCLPQGITGDSIVVVVHTVEADGGGSVVTVYDERWRPLSHFGLPCPSIGSYLSSHNGSEDVVYPGKMASQLSRQPVLITFDETEPIVRFTLSTAGLDEATKSEAARLLHTVTYRWDGAGFRPLSE